MHIGLICPEVPGHLNPMTALGRELARRGNRVSIVAAPRGRERVERAGLGFLAIGEPEHADGSAAAAWEKLGELSGLAAMRWSGRVLREAAAAMQRDLPAVIRSAQIDALVIDQFSPAAVVVAESLAMPYAIACNAIVGHYDPVGPPPPTLWRYRPGWVGRVRNRIAIPVLRFLYDWLSGANTAGGVPPLKLVFETHCGLVHVAQQPAFFDFPRQLPAHFHYTAPWHEPHRDDDLPFPWERLDGRPLVYASMGTLQNKLQHVYEAIARAAEGLDVQVALALGNPTASLEITPPDNVIVVPFAPQLRLLDRAAAAITHAGLNTALECLARGVPMVCLPVTNDQPGVARRVEWLGAGEVLPVGRVNVKRLRRLLMKVLDDPKHREAAGRARRELAAVNGAGMAADIIERALSPHLPARISGFPVCPDATRV